MTDEVFISRRDLMLAGAVMHRSETMDNAGIQLKVDSGTVVAWLYLHASKLETENHRLRLRLAAKDRGR